ncbi:hypothetical protein CP965_09675 [Halarcobacter mediterraneus]|uniref:Uncharacterized protein n=1 Tax=Halarcobacter mediterraneus TaxID=2023153 RepID=A0A4Q1AVA6_9BACT|nr:hypothetical protein [Halarcobacter mediterraneus]RXK12832.1 hypothetical protein CP965_09675 [Halarcobacter mediterraneus]
MRFIYIKNYLNISREKKFEFIKYIYCFDKFKVINQKIVLNDNSLIMELDSNSSFEIAKKSIDTFFKDYEDIESFFVDSLAIEENKLFVMRDNKVVRSVYIK